MLRQGARASEHLSDFFWCGDGVCAVEQIVIISPSRKLFGVAWRFSEAGAVMKDLAIITANCRGLPNVTHDGFAIADD
jgi:hypothetical protein